MEKFEKVFQIRSYECDKFGALRVVSLMNIFQDVADLSATKLGFGFDFCKSTGVTWVGTNYKVEIKRLPQVHEQIKFVTWPSGANKFMALRDFTAFDENGDEIIKATSQWVLVDTFKKRPVSLNTYLPDYLYIDEHVIVPEFEKLSMPEKIDFSKQFEVRFDDIDLNCHVNNAIYPLWAAESLDADFHEKYIPSRLDISYKKECLYGESVKVLTQLHDLETKHAVMTVDNAKELALLCFKWQKR